MECQREENSASCICDNKDCERNGKCCACIAFHRVKGNMPACLRKLYEDEATQTFES